MPSRDFASEDLSLENHRKDAVSAEGAAEVHTNARVASTTLCTRCRLATGRFQQRSEAWHTECLPPLDIAL